MQFSVGYQLRQDERLIQQMLRHKEQIYEVYFAFGNYPNGRNTQEQSDLFLPHEATAKQLSDLGKLAKAGIRLNILFNGNCYGKDAQSRRFFSGLGDTVDFFVREYALSSVTTTSPLIARFIKENFPTLTTRASVNMEIGTEEGMDYLADVFDSYYLKRELNRDFAAIRRLRRYCDENGKQLFLLANSGCLNACSSHIFHDNLVAHESEIAAMDNAYAFRGSCWDYLSKPEKRSALVRQTNYIRPEDMHLYEGLVTAAKLATRVNAAPERILEAYTAGKYVGSTLELLEPNHAGLLYPQYLDNRRFPADFAEHVGHCSKDCRACGYCEQVYQNAIINLEETTC